MPKGISIRQPKKFYEITDNGCWKGLRSTDLDGYPQITFNKKHQKMATFFYKIFKGHIKKGLVIDHLCRNRICINPDHLETVTVAENSRRGANTKLTYKIVDSIKSLYKRSGMNQFILAKQYNVNQSTISRIINGKRWVA